MQHDLFANSELELLREEISDLKASSEAVRRGIYARHDQIKRDLEKIKEMISKTHYVQMDIEEKISPIGF